MPQDVAKPGVAQLSAPQQIVGLILNFGWVVTFELVLSVLLKSRFNRLAHAYEFTGSSTQYGGEFE